MRGAGVSGIAVIVTARGEGRELDRSDFTEGKEGLCEEWEGDARVEAT